MCGGLGVGSIPSVDAGVDEGGWGGTSAGRLGRDGSVAVATFADADFGTVTLDYRYALLYNASKNDRAVAVFDFGSLRVVSAGDLLIRMPPATATNAIVRIGG